MYVPRTTRAQLAILGLALCFGVCLMAQASGEQVDQLLNMHKSMPGIWLAIEPRKGHTLSCSDLPHSQRWRQTLLDLNCSFAQSCIIPSAGISLCWTGSVCSFGSSASSMIFEMHDSQALYM